MIIRNYYEQLHTNKLRKLEETDKFLDTDNQPTLNEKEMRNLSIPIMSNEIELVMKSLPKKKSPETNGFTA